MQVWENTRDTIVSTYPEFSLYSLDYETEKADDGRHVTVTFKGIDRKNLTVKDISNADFIYGQVVTTFHGSLKKQYFTDSELVEDSITVVYRNPPQEDDTFDVIVNVSYGGNEEPMTLRNIVRAGTSGKMRVQDLICEETLSLGNYQETETGVSGTMPVTLHIVYGGAVYDETVEAQVTYQRNREWEVRISDPVVLEPNE
jgi:hypothetical protein